MVDIELNILLPPDKVRVLRNKKKSNALSWSFALQVPPHACTLTFFLYRLNVRVIFVISRSVFAFYYWRGFCHQNFGAQVDHFTPSLRMSLPLSPSFFFCATLTTSTNFKRFFFSFCIFLLLLINQEQDGHIVPTFNWKINFIVSWRFLCLHSVVSIERSTVFICSRLPAGHHFPWQYSSSVQMVSQSSHLQHFAFTLTTL